MNERGVPPDTALLPYLSPLGWEHINLTGDYVWHQDRKLQVGRFGPLRPVPGADPKTRRSSRSVPGAIDPAAMSGALDVV